MSDSYESIIVPLDGSPLAERAIPFALAIARQAGAGAHIELVHVHEKGTLAPNAPMVDTTWENERAAEMSGAMSALAERVARESGVAVTAVTLRGPTASSIVRHSVNVAADLIVTTTHGRSGFSRAWFGSVAEEVVHSAPTPVLIVREGERDGAVITEPLFRRVLLPIDRASSGEEAMQRARSLGGNGAATYTLLTVVTSFTVMPSPYLAVGVIEEAGDFARRRDEAAAVLEAIAAPARADGATVNIRVVSDSPVASVILKVAEQEADLVVLPAHPDGAFSRAFLGSVADKLIRGATVPLLLFRAPARDGAPALAMAGAADRHKYFPNHESI